MKAIAIIPGTTDLTIVDRPEPKIEFPDEVKIRVLQVGICGTDREEAAGGRAEAPPSSKELVIGHEMIGKVVEVGSEVVHVKPGDLAMFTVRRGCGKCAACLMNRSDDCYTGEYTERGIRGRDGYQAEFVVDREINTILFSPDMGAYGVLAEPTSVAEKAIDTALRIQLARMPAVRDPETWLNGTRVLVAGIGPVGLLTAMLLRLRGAQVFGMDIVDSNSERSALLKKMGGTYLNGKEITPEEIPARFGAMEQIYDATGDAPLEFSLLSALDYNGIYALLGIPGKDEALQLREGEIIKSMVLKNQVLFGSVNESRMHVQAAVRDLKSACEKWGQELFNRIITHRVSVSNFKEVLQSHAEGEIKAVIQWQ